MAHAAFKIGETVEMKDKSDKEWCTGTVTNVYPLTVRLDNIDAEYKWDEVRKINQQQHEEKLKEVKEYKLEDAPPGLDPAELNIYPDILRRSSTRFIWFYILMGASLPFVFNTVWMALGNIVNDGYGLQNLPYYMFFNDFYFMTVKGTMISCYFHSFMPHSEIKSKYWLYALLLFMFPFYNTVVHMVWIAADQVHSDSTWILMKLNFPVGATLALVSFMPIYILNQWPQRKPGESFLDSPRIFALRRYIILVIVLVGDLIFIATSHIYVFYFFKYQRGELGVTFDSWVVERAVELLWVSAFSQIYMPLLGKIWQFAIFLFDKLAPMPDLQRQRLFFFATVILDMHRIMYAREIFTGLKGYTIFVLVLLKDQWYDIYHFGIKSLPEVQAIILQLDEAAKEPGMQVFRVKCFDKIGYVLKLISDMIECPRKVVAVFFWKIDACYYQAPRRPISFFFGDNVVRLVNVPRASSPEFTDAAKRAEAMQEWNAQIYAAATKQGSFDEAHATAFSTLRANSSVSRTGCIKTIMSDPWKTEFYKSVSLTLTGWIYGRYMVRGTIKLASGLMFLVTGFVIRNTPSKEVMNTIMDHSTEMPSELWIFGALFVISDVIKEIIVRRMLMADEITDTFAKRRFARLFVSNSFLVMILSCHICCNSDVFLTFANLDFGE